MATILLCTNNHRNKDTVNMLGEFKNSSRRARFSSIHERSVRFVEITVADEHAENAMSFFQTKYPETAALNITPEFSNVVELVIEAEPAQEEQPSLLEIITSNVSEVIDDMLPKQPEAQLVNA